MTDGWQGMLFGAADADDDPAGDDHELRICALNVNRPSRERAQRLTGWLLATKCNALVLTEMRPTDGGQLILASLEAEGFEVTCTPGWQGSSYLAALATRGISVTSVEPVPFDPRIVTLDLATAGATVRLAGVYGPTNGMTAESSQRRQDFQRRLLAHLAAISSPALCVAGDLNVIEPGHRPSLPGFEAHDYAFYTGLLDLGLQDAYRTLQPEGQDHSWISPRFGNQRLDHILIGRAAGTVRECGYDHAPRNGHLTDHAAMLATVQTSGKP